jgi:hypothetical protein
VADQVLYTLPDGSEVPLRHTFILHKETDQWKIVHIHYSTGMTNQ